MTRKERDKGRKSEGGDVRKRLNMILRSSFIDLHNEEEQMKKI